MKFSMPAPASPSRVAHSPCTGFDPPIDAWLGAASAGLGRDLHDSGPALAVQDTGLRVSHSCFAGRVFATQPCAAQAAAPDPSHSHCSAPRASLCALQLQPAPTGEAILAALSWIGENAARLGITVAHLSLGACGVNRVDAAQLRAAMPRLAAALQELHTRRIAVVIETGHDDDTAPRDRTNQLAHQLAGAVLLLQQQHQRRTGELPPVPLLRQLLRSRSKCVVAGKVEAEAEAEDEDEEGDADAQQANVPGLWAAAGLCSAARARSDVSG